MVSILVRVSLKQCVILTGQWLHTVWPELKLQELVAKLSLVTHIVANIEISSSGHFPNSLMNRSHATQDHASLLARLRGGGNMKKAWS